MKPRAHARFIIAALSAFGAAAVAGGAFAMFGAIAAIRWLGLFATLGGLAGCAMQLALLREVDPSALGKLFGRIHAGFAPLASRASVLGSRLRASWANTSTDDKRLAAGA